MVRHKNRFLVVDVHCRRGDRSCLSGALASATGKGGTQAPASGVPQVHAAIQEQVKRCFGTTESGSMLAALQVRASGSGGAGEEAEDAEAGGGLSFVLRCVVRCNREHCRGVRAAISLVTELLGVRVCLTVTKTKGSLRTLASTEAKPSSS